MFPSLEGMCKSFAPQPLLLHCLLWYHGRPFTVDPFVAFVMIEDGFCWGLASEQAGIRYLHVTYPWITSSHWGVGIGARPVPGELLTN